MIQKELGGVKEEKSRVEVDDNIYLNEDRYENPKEIFKFIANLTKQMYLQTDKIDILDVGCATGELIYYLRTQFQKSACTGIDASETMIHLARNKMPTETWLCEDVLTVPYAFKKQYDVVCCIGVLQIFDNIEHPINNLLSAVKAGKSLYIAGIFNANPVDVISRYRAPQSSNSDWLPGWNIFSMETYEAILSTKCSAWEWHDFVMPCAIKKTDDPMRSWTVDIGSNSFQLVNGASQLLNIKVLEIRK